MPTVMMSLPFGWEVAGQPNHPHCNATSFERGQLTRIMRKAASDQVVLVKLYVVPPGAIAYAMGAIIGSRGPASRAPVGGPSRR
jgi:hypothetical protein